MIRAMKESAAADGLSQVIIPVRPSQKSQHPNVPFAEYITWKRTDGQPYDPWLRIHQRLGAEVLTIAPGSMVIPGTIAQWEGWTGTPFPNDGDYAVAGALVPVTIDHEHDSGLYEEPNLWMRYIVHAA
jgi:hypothetical protein